MSRFSATPSERHLQAASIRWWANFGLSLCGADYAVPKDDDLAEITKQPFGSLWKHDHRDTLGKSDRPS